MPTITITADFKGKTYEADIDIDTLDLVETFEGGAVVALEGKILFDPPEGFDPDVEPLPDSLDGFDAWGVTEVDDMPSILTGPGSEGRLDDINTVINAYGTLEDHQFDVYVVWCDDNNHLYTADEFWQRYLGSFDMEGDYAAELLNDLIDLRKPEYDMVRNYIDYEGMERDMMLNGDIDVIEQGFTRHIFRTY